MATAGEAAVQEPVIRFPFPTLCLAVDPDQVPMCTGSNLYGLHELSVAW